MIDYIKRNAKHHLHSLLKHNPVLPLYSENCCVNGATLLTNGKIWTTPTMKFAKVIKVKQIVDRCQSGCCYLFSILGPNASALYQQVMNAISDILQWDYRL